jgi:hypothetical protein
MAAEEDGEGGRARELAVVRLVDGRLEVLGREDRREVEQGAGDRGDRKAAVGRQLVAGDGGGAQADAGALAAGDRRRDLDERGSPEAPERRGGPVAEDGASPLARIAAIQRPSRVRTRCPTA